MKGVSLRAFCVQLGFLLSALCLSLGMIAGAAGASLSTSFHETAARTDMLLSLLSSLLIMAISLFSAYITHRHRKTRRG